jgi:hypothetical protein
MHEIKPDSQVAWSIINSFPRGAGGFWAAWECGELEVEVMDWFRARARLLGLQDRIRLADERLKRWGDSGDPLAPAVTRLIDETPERPVYAGEETHAVCEETLARPGLAPEIPGPLTTETRAAEEIGTRPPLPRRRGFTLASGFTYTSATGLIDSADYHSLQEQLEQAPLLETFLESVNYDPGLASDFRTFVLTRARTERVTDFHRALEDWLRHFARQNALPAPARDLGEDDWRRIVETAVVQGYLQWQVRHCKDDSTRALCQKAIDQGVRSQKELEGLRPPSEIKPAAARHSRQQLVSAVRTKIAKAQTSSGLS